MTDTGTLAAPETVIQEAVKSVQEATGKPPADAPDAPAAPPDDAPEKPADDQKPGDAPEGEATEEAPEGEETPDALELPEGWRDHPDVKAISAGSYDKAKSDLTKAHRRELLKAEETLATEMEQVHTTQLRQVAERAQAKGVVLEMANALKELDPTDGRALFEVIQQSEEWAGAFNNHRFIDGMNVALNDLTTSEELMAGLDDELLDELAQERRRVNLRLRREEVPLDQPNALKKNAALMQGALRELLAHRDKLRDEVIVRDALAKEKARIEKLAKTEAEARSRANGRANTAPPAKVSGAGGGGHAITSMGDADRRYNLPAGNPERISHEAYKAARERFGVKAR